MKTTAFITAGIILISGSSAAFENQTEVGISVADGRLRSFYLAVGDHYRVPSSRVIALRERHRLRPDDLPVVFFLASRANVEPTVILDLRLGRKSWLDIAVHFGLTSEIFFIPVTTARVGPPYGNAYGHYKKHKPGRDWGKIVLSDREIVDLVNLRFMSEHYGISPGEIMEMRGGGQNFLMINESLGKNKSTGKKEKKPIGKGKSKKKR